MEKIFSARIDEAVLHRISLLAQRLHTSKKNVIETAITRYADQVENEQKIDVLKETCGAWKRKTTPSETVQQAQKEFRNSMTRHQK